MSDERFRSLRRLAEATGDSVTWQALVWDHLRTGQPFDVPTAMVATAMANQLSRGGAGLVGKGEKQRKHTNLPEQVELDAALLASGYLKLHHSMARLRRVLIRHFGSAKAALAWANKAAALSPSPDTPIRLTQHDWLRNVLARVQLPVAQHEASERRDVDHGVARLAGFGHTPLETALRELQPDAWGRSLDGLRVGTPFYGGGYPFWDPEYDMLLNQSYRPDHEPVPEPVLVALHDALLAEGLHPHAVSRRHGEIMTRFAGEGAAWLRHTTHSRFVAALARYQADRAARGSPSGFTWGDD